MKTFSILFGAILMATAAPAFAQAASGTQGMKMDKNMQGMPMHQNGSDMQMNCMQMGKGMQKGNGMRGMQMGKKMPCANQTAQATGIVEAINTAKGTVTIKHQAITSLHWPAMTMTFKVNPPSLLQAIKVGEKVHFTLHVTGMNGTVTALSPVK